MALYGEKLSFKVSLRVGGRVPNYNATSGPQLTAEAEFESVELVSWGQVWQKVVWQLFLEAETQRTWSSMYLEDWVTEWK